MGTTNRSVDLVGLSHRYRVVSVLLLSLLLLGMQQEGFWHALTHFKPAPTHQELSGPQADTPCDKCTLLAAGSSVLPSGTPVLGENPGAHVAVLPAHTAPSLARLSFYRSRAPPSLS